MMSRIADSFHSISAAYMMKNRDTEFDDITTYVNAFADKLAVTDRISQRLLKEQYGLCPYECLSFTFVYSYLFKVDIQNAQC